MVVSKSDAIIIVGGGAFGLSSALHLSRKGYTNISIFEKDDSVPPRSSAANDLNKIVRAEYEDPFYTDLTIKAIDAWKTPLFAPHFHQTGFLHCVSGAAPEKAVDTLNRFRASAEKEPKIQPHVIPLKNVDDVRLACWQLDGELPGWHGYLNRFDGYAHSGNALAAVYRETQASGVRFFLGEQGAVDEIVYVSTLNGRKCAGIRTKNGRFHPSSLVIVAAGAGAGRLVPEIGKEVVAKSWSVAHVHLTDEETSALRGIPVTYARDLGFFFEPDPKTNLLKLCPMGGGYINTDPKTGVSHAPENLGDSAFLPEEDEQQLRKLLRQTLPSLADRPFVRKSLCWFADTNDSDFIVDYIPETSSSIILLSGDSGHGFKMFPIVGSWVTDLLSATDAKQSVARWRWKQPSPNAGKADWGGDVSWRLGQSKEFHSILPPKSSKL
ncbi:FAD dependent oxidoreductase [Penicillium longicatenatum]|uniref:FAD dependent oxidoreductase n=1 Tax=Penicillium longicatenatum TaxID=1561947 RepID=UPI002548581C|nr:FAD dependent oxidoreductase [Penicillium longicatenatum]KAJ5657437.1 FAD dependent oxidoreductase [Penicillium longicatenatum]